MHTTVKRDACNSYRKFRYHVCAACTVSDIQADDKVEICRSRVLWKAISPPSLFRILSVKYMLQNFSKTEHLAPPWMSALSLLGCQIHKKYTYDSKWLHFDIVCMPLRRSVLSKWRQQRKRTAKLRGFFPHSFLLPLIKYCNFKRHPFPISGKTFMQKFNAYSAVRHMVVTISHTWTYKSQKTWCCHWN